MTMLILQMPRVARLAATASLLLAAGCGDPGPRALLDGEKMINERRFAEAVDRLTLATHLLPDNPQAWNHRGLAHHGARQNVDAEKAYRMALQLNENLAAARFNLGSLLLESGDPEAAIEELGSFVVLRPTSVEGHVRLGSAQIRAGRWEDAAATFSQAYQLGESNPETLNALGLIHLHRGEREKAYPFFDKAIELNANYAPAKFNRAICEHRYGDDKTRALAAYQSFMLQHPDTPLAEQALIAATSLEKILNPVPAEPQPATGPGGLALAQRTDRATAAAPESDNTPAAPEVAATTSTPPANDNPPKPSSLTIQPMTERAPTASVAGEAASTPPPPDPAPVKMAAVLPSEAAPIPPSAAKPEPPAFEPAPPKPSVSNETGTAAVAKPAPHEMPGEPAGKNVPEIRPEPTRTEAPPVTETVEARIASEPAAPTPSRPMTPEAPKPVETAPPPPAPTPAPVKHVIAAPPVETASANPMPSPTTTPPRSYVPEYRPERDEEGGFLRRLDPRRFFKSKDAKPTTPLNPGERQAPAPRETVVTASKPVAQPPTPTPAPNPAPAPAVAPPPRAEPPRYAYVNPPAPKSGDRRAATPVFLEALKAHQENRLSDAIKLYRDAARLDASLYETHYNLGLASYRANDLSLSLRAYETALAVKPDSGSARFNFAQALTRARYTRDAANELEKLIAAEPDQVSAHLAAGNLYAKELGDRARAREHYLKVIALDPNHRQAQAIRYWLSQNR